MTSFSAHRPTLREIADRAGVSVMTVSYAFSNPDRVSDVTREKVLAAADELGYQGKNPWATALRRGRAGALGVVFSEHLTYAFTDPQAADFLAGVASVCAQEGLGLTIIPTIGDAEDAQRVAAAPVDGYIFWTTRADDPSLAAAAATHRPCAIQGGPEHDGFIRIGIPDRLAATAIARLGLAEDIRSPIVLSFSLDSDRAARADYGIAPCEAQLPVTRDRLAGFRDAVHEVGLEWGRIYVLALSRNDRAEAQRALAKAIVDGIPMDLVLCTSDQLALGALDALREGGLRVPEQVSVTGWDDGPLAGVAGVSTVRQSMYEQGRACGTVAAGLNGVERPVSWEIVRRASTRTGAAV